MKILTIDFDIIMEPNIESYNNYVNIDKTYDECFEGVPQANLQIYNLLSDIILNAKCPIEFVQSHEEVYYILLKNNIINAKLINIDHHHDLGYGDNSGERITCSNWVGRAIDHNLVKKYLWVNDNTSQNPADFIEEKYQFLYQTTSIHTAPIHQLYNVDRIIVCKSASWIPGMYLPLYEVWEKLDLWKNL